jgi:lysophospholipase L1-like esterase
VVTRVLGAVGLVLALCACTSGRLDRPRALPADRNAPVVYVALGDSTVEGVAATSPAHTYVSRLHERLRAVYPAASVANLGQAGAVSADVLEQQLARAIAMRPHLVTVSVGPNDITEGVAVETYERNMAAIFRTLTRETGAVVVANLLPDLAVTPRFRLSGHRAAVGARTVEFNRALQSRARDLGVELVDLYAASRAEVPVRPELVASDGYHPSDAGYARWAELTWARIEPRIATR